MRNKQKFDCLPTTMYYSNTACAKDAATRKQIHEIKNTCACRRLIRFQKRMDDLTKRISQANAEAEQVQIKKIS